MKSEKSFFSLVFVIFPVFDFATNNNKLQDFMTKRKIKLIFLKNGLKFKWDGYFIYVFLDAKKPLF